jgi:hypothetical protein
MSLPSFPIPTVGRTMITPLSSDNTFLLTSSDLSADQRNDLVGFFMQMQGRFRVFRFDFGNVAFSTCRFDSDEGPNMAAGAGPHSVTFPIKVLLA